MDINDCYKALDLQPGATLEEIRMAYRDMVRVWHPDNYTNNPRIQKKAEEKLKGINAAYEFLTRQPSKREDQSQTTKRTEQSHQQSSARWAAFITDLRDGELVEIVELHPEDDYYSLRSELIGSLIMVKSPLHKGSGWYCTHAVIKSKRAICVNHLIEEKALSGFVRVRRPLN